MWRILTKHEAKMRLILRDAKPQRCSRCRHIITTISIAHYKRVMHRQVTKPYFSEMALIAIHRESGVFKAIANTAECLDEIAMLAEFASYCRHVHIHGTFGHLGVFTAYSINDLITCEYPPWTPRQKVQNVEFCRSQIHHLVSCTHFIAPGMDHNIVIDYCGLFVCLALLAPQHSFHACQQDTRTKRLGEVIIGTQFEPSHNISVLASGGEHHNGNTRCRRIA